MIGALNSLRWQQPTMPVIGNINVGTPAGTADVLAAFRQGLGEIGYVEKQNVTIEYRWAEGHYDRLPGLAADLVRGQVAVLRRTEDGERGQELRTVDRSLHPHHRERDRNLRRSPHCDRYRMVHVSPAATADIRARRRRLQDPHRSIALARRGRHR